MASSNTVSKEELKKAFEEADENKSGKLNYQQFTAFASKFEQISHKDVNDIFKHQELHQDEKAISLEEFYVWWDNKEKNLLPVFYFKQQMQKQISKAKKVIQKQKESGPQQYEQSKFEVSINNGTNEGQTLLSLYLSSHQQSKKDCQKYQELFKLGSKPGFIIKLKTSKNVDEAKTALEDLVEQVKQFVECILPVEISEQYMSMLDIQVEKDGNDLLLSFSSGNNLITSLADSYQNIVNEFKVDDQSIVLKLSCSSQLNIEKSASTANSILADLIKGLQINASFSASSFMLDNLRNILYSKILKEIKQEDGSYAEYSRRKKQEEAAFLVLASLINGISINLNTQKIEDMLPASITGFTFEELISNAKKYTTSAEDQLQLPIIQELIQFFNEYTLSDVECLGIFPESFVSIHFKTIGLSTILGKILNV
ncbi:EF hand protein (macronuclear) [Tetrahymena thermophila SB210]|uniref:EF hand protein n=1 Tax=Tetrahymena thermophila (strain SB210) TaxID=312017 RepID=I7LVY0_TETTS|nr:EF hand protein [Tetrahymena thermophila SB210]EAS00315.1 EF hand protein [Tetrahymena thermophila SB210]|eukprot:XP_001020560.1 EF hand protein [Tetrahymena thermophila SB210]